MKKVNLTFNRIFLLLAAGLTLSIAATSCSKSNSSPAGGTTQTDNGGHHVDGQFVGKWMWTEASDGAYYDNNGVYSGSAYGLAMQYTINADGSGTCYNHIYSSIGVGTGLEVNISYKGFFESDAEGHLGFFPTSGTYSSSSSGTRALREDELWNNQTKTGRSMVYQQVTFVTQGQRAGFTVTSSNGKVDTFFKQ